MTPLDSHKLLIFGAGKIGRSFIGQLFHRGGYEVVFIDVFKGLIDELNNRKNYNVIIKEEDVKVLNINNIRGIWAEDKDEVVREIADASILAVSVGLTGLDAVANLISNGLLERFKHHPEAPLDIIIAENLRNASETMYGKLKLNLPSWYPIDSMVGLIETSIGKMVPIMLEKDLEEDFLQVFAESYNTLILDKLAFKNPIPSIEGLAPKENIKAWVDRKLFIHNLGHVCAAYYGAFHFPKSVYMYEVLSHKKVREYTYESMSQSGNVLKTMYPDEFTTRKIQDHILDLIARFQNKALGDTVFRVGSDLCRKLGSNDRLGAPLMEGIRRRLPVERIAEAFFFGVNFRASDENGKLHRDDITSIELISQHGPRYFLEKRCGLTTSAIDIISESFNNYNSPF